MSIGSTSLASILQASCRLILSNTYLSGAKNQNASMTGQNIGWSLYNSSSKILTLKGIWLTSATICCYGSLIDSTLCCYCLYSSLLSLIYFLHQFLITSKLYLQFFHLVLLNWNNGFVLAAPVYFSQAPKICLKSWFSTAILVNSHLWNQLTFQASLNCSLVASLSCLAI